MADLQVRATVDAGGFTVIHTDQGAIVYDLKGQAFQISEHGCSCGKPGTCVHLQAAGFASKNPTAGSYQTRQGAQSKPKSDQVTIGSWNKKGERLSAPAFCVWMILTVLVWTLRMFGELLYWVGRGLTGRWG